MIDSTFQKAILLFHSLRAFIRFVVGFKNHEKNHSINEYYEFAILHWIT